MRIRDAVTTALLFTLPLASVTALAGGKDEALVERTRKQLVGTWASPKGEVRDEAHGQKNYLTRRFTFTRDASSATFVYFTDATYKVPKMTVRFSGAFTLHGESPSVKGAVEADFPLSTLRLLPHTADAVAWLNSAKPGTCGTQPWQVGVEQDVTPTGGCGVLGINTATTVEYDVVKVTGRELTFGARPTEGGLLDAPTKRPTSLQVPVVREP
jgi:hypothetical protein